MRVSPRRNAERTRPCAAICISGLRTPPSRHVPPAAAGDSDASGPSRRRQPDRRSATASVTATPVRHPFFDSQARSAPRLLPPTRLSVPRQFVPRTPRPCPRSCVCEDPHVASSRCRWPRSFASPWCMVPLSCQHAVGEMSNARAAPVLSAALLEMAAFDLFETCAAPQPPREDGSAWSVSSRRRGRAICRTSRSPGRSAPRRAAKAYRPAPHRPVPPQHGRHPPVRSRQRRLRSPERAPHAAGPGLGRAAGDGVDTVNIGDCIGCKSVSNVMYPACQLHRRPDAQTAGHTDAARSDIVRTDLTRQGLRGCLTRVCAALAAGHVKLADQRALPAAPCQATRDVLRRFMRDKRFGVPVRRLGLGVVS